MLNAKPYPKKMRFITLIYNEGGKLVQTSEDDAYKTEELALAWADGYMDGYAGQHGPNIRLKTVEVDINKKV